MELIYVVVVVILTVVLTVISYFLGLSKQKLKNAELESQISMLSSEKENLEYRFETLNEDKKAVDYTLELLKQEKNELLNLYNTLNVENQRLEVMYSNLDVEKQRIDALLDKLTTENTELNGVKSRLDSDFASLSTENANLKSVIVDLKQQTENTEKQFKESFENIASKILEDRIKTINKDGEVQIKRSIEPLEKELTGFKARIEEIYLSDTKERASISKELENLLKLNQQLSSDADSLAKAIKGDNNPKMQGDWGEMILDTILSNSGLKRGEHYFTQESSKDEEGTIKRPDVIVRYPDGREIIIDSKVSLTAYSRYISAESDLERDEALKNHLMSIRRHVDDLSSKQYENRENSLDFVMMFIPIDPAYILALSSDNSLWEYAYKRKIIIVTPTHLITALKLIYDLWSRDAQNRNAIDIAARGAAMYDKFVGFVTDMQSIGTSLDKTRKSYDLALNKLNTGRGNLVRQAEMLKDLGVRASKELNMTSYELGESQNEENTEINN